MASWLRTKIGQWGTSIASWAAQPAGLSAVTPEGVAVPVVEAFEPEPQPEAASPAPQVEAAAAVRAVVSGRRLRASIDTATRDRDLKEAFLTMPAGLSIDPDDDQFRRLTSGQKIMTRDLDSVRQERMLEIAWYLWEANPLAKRLIQLSTDLVIGEGITVTAADERLAEQISKTWAHPMNQLHTRPRQLHNALALNGELILPVTVNPFTGRPIFGFIDPLQVKQIKTVPGNALIPDIVELKGVDGLPGEQLKIIREDAATGKLVGEVFYVGINQLPNSRRGRSDLLPLADWLDLYDQYMFAEVERLNLLSNFVWDLEIQDADDKRLKERLRDFPTPKPGTVFAHNQKEKLEARTPDLKATDRSEVARLLVTHIAGSMGFPTSYLGYTDSNKSTIEGQNDVMMKTPAARQREFKVLIEQIVRFTIEQTTMKNPALFRDVDPAFKVSMPEIQTKDVARVGTSVSQIASAMDTAKNAGMISKRVGTVAIVAILRHLGIEENAADVLAEAEKEQDDEQEKRDEQMQLAMQRAAEPGVMQMQPRATGRPGRTNPPIEDPERVGRAA